MKSFLAFLIIVVVGYLATAFGPWYLIAVAGFAGGWVVQHQWRGLFIGFLAGFILWSAQIWLMTTASNSDLPLRMADLFSLPNDTALILISALVGGLLTGFGAAAGGSLRTVFGSKQ